MFHFVILANEIPQDHLFWIKACEKHPDQISYRVVNLIQNNWLEELKKEPADFLLAKPGGFVEAYKQLFDERVRVLANVLGYKVYPSLEEIQVYENKRYLAAWLEANNIPHPKTMVFYHKNEALHYISSSSYPIVAKLNIGASGNGVNIIKSQKEAIYYIDKIFRKGIRLQTGPKFKKGRLMQRLLTNLKHPSLLINRLKTYHYVYSNPQRGYCLFQEYVPHQFEWRVVRVGDSFFAHKKMVKDDKASGTLIKSYQNPPMALLDFVREITDKAGFRSVAIDIFEKNTNSYLVNEIQCIFGQSDPWQMMVDNKPGRYYFKNNQWVFEEGMFNGNQSYDLRINDVMGIMNKARLE